MVDSSLPLSRRTLLAGGAAAATLAALGARPLAAEDGPPKIRRVVPDMPVGYVSHGSPATALSKRHNADWHAWAKAQPKPVAVLVVSAHFQRAPITIGATKKTPLVYDFRGFPRALYEIQYDPPGAPKLARRVEQVLGAKAVRRAPTRGHDHGAWVPLRAMYPQADVPILSVSLPSHDPEALYRMGRSLRPLRKEGVFILGSGAMTHNLRYRPPQGTKTPGWAAEFDAWSRETLEQGDVDTLLDWRKKAPGARMSHPTVEHFVPLLIAAGARRDNDAASFPLTGFDSVAFSRRCVSFAPPPPRAG